MKRAASTTLAALLLGAWTAHAGSVNPMSQGLKSLQGKDYTTAIGWLRAAALDKASSADIHARLGEAYYLRAYSRGAQGQPDLKDVRRAVDAYETALALDPVFSRVEDRYMLHHGLAMCYQALGRSRDSLRALRGAIKAEPDNPMPYLYASTVRLDLQDAPKSSENFLQAVLLSRRLKGYRSLSKLVRTDPRFKGLMRSPPHRIVLAAYDEVARGRLSEAKAMARINGASDAPDDLRDSLGPKPKRRRGPKKPVTDPAVEQEIFQGDLDARHERLWEAVAHYREALRLDEGMGSLTLAAKSKVLEKTGDVYRRLGLAGEAVKLFDQALVERPDNASAYFQLSLSYSVLGHYTKSLLCLSQALQKADTIEELRRLMLQARAEPDLAPIRDLAGFKKVMDPYAQRLSARRS